MSDKPSKFKKRPHPAQAMRYDGQNDFQITSWSRGMVFPSPVLEPSDENQTGAYMQVRTATGYMAAKVGDWIVRDEDGYYYAMTDDFFNHTYEPVNE